ncbi:hypothetical protein [Thermodesulfatator atlanticus]|uniref:hypothetical protein n=1 Tax=Thermodesulfatator atlanticus TaxID=501497 RepID=UPI0003B77A01|nr:hypothetical protein [Thermodesulfatator atlanticus]
MARQAKITAAIHKTAFAFQKIFHLMTLQPSECEKFFPQISNINGKIFPTEKNFSLPSLKFNIKRPELSLKIKLILLKKNWHFFCLTIKVAKI